jgi:adenylylsulfate kinase-like enzyme
VAYLLDGDNLRRGLSDDLGSRLATEPKTSGESGI